MRMSWSRLGLIVLCLVATACAPAPIRRPIKGGDVDTGPGSPEFVRRQLAGRWQLISLTIYSASGQATSVPAEAELSYDEFGNMNIRGRLLDAASSEPPPILQHSGRAVIDAANNQLHLLDSAGDALDSAAVSDAISFDRVRLYEFSGEELTLTAIDAGGKPTAVTRWRK